jgi:hypothetical protein
LDLVSSVVDRHLFIALCGLFFTGKDRSDSITADPIGCCKIQKKYKKTDQRAPSHRDGDRLVPGAPLDRSLPSATVHRSPGRLGAEVVWGTAQAASARPDLSACYGAEGVCRSAPGKPTFFPDQISSIKKRTKRMSLARPTPDALCG